MNDEIKPRTVYLLKRTDRPNDGKDLYVGSTSKTLKERLHNHKSETQRRGKVNKSKLYTRMIEIGVNNWELVPLLSFTCDKKTILEFEREWCGLLNADLNTILAVNTEEEKRERSVRDCAKYYVSNKKYFVNYYKYNSVTSFSLLIYLCEKNSLSYFTKGILV